MANKEVTAKKNNAVATIDIEKFADQGFDNIDSKSLQLPFLKILGQLSPQVTAGDSKYIEAAKPGMIYNTVTDKLYDGNKGILVIPAYYKFEYIEWADRGQGTGAPINVYESTSDILTKTTRDDNRKDRLENGNYVETCGNHFILLVNDDGDSSPAVITMKSTQLKKSRKWNSMMLNVKLKGKSGLFTPPSYSHFYRLKAVKEKNDKGNWHGWEVSREEQVTDANLYQIAKSFAESVNKGERSVKYEEEVTKTDVPF